GNLFAEAGVVRHGDPRAAHRECRHAVDTEDAIFPRRRGDGLRDGSAAHHLVQVLEDDEGRLLEQLGGDAFARLFFVLSLGHGSYWVTERKEGDGFEQQALARAWLRRLDEVERCGPFDDVPGERQQQERDDRRLVGSALERKVYDHLVQQRDGSLHVRRRRG